MHTLTPYRMTYHTLLKQQEQETTDTNSDISLRLDVAINEQLFSVVFPLIKNNNKIEVPFCIKRQPVQLSSTFHFLSLSEKFHSPR